MARDVIHQVFEGVHVTLRPSVCLENEIYQRALPGIVASGVYIRVCVCVCARRQAVIITFLSCTLTGARGLYTTLASNFFFS